MISLLVDITIYNVSQSISNTLMSELQSEKTTGKKLAEKINNDVDVERYKNEYIEMMKPN